MISVREQIRNSLRDLALCEELEPIRAYLRSLSIEERMKELSKLYEAAASNETKTIVFQEKGEMVLVDVVTGPDGKKRILIP